MIKAGCNCEKPYDTQPKTTVGCRNGVANRRCRGTEKPPQLFALQNCLARAAAALAPQPGVRKKPYQTHLSRTQTRRRLRIWGSVWRSGTAEGGVVVAPGRGMCTDKE
ncbi:diguanylate phosphodiesterase [Anopheles sinensis]|uniref:Diguanylate phosphodiesterase n=1 Tax=Anopheles sinensis TaxID=74873 RepID=A0A084WLH6_ANOSI|nr:diguanylate phosphodiesterase [Anopheles sinensis]